MNIYIAKQDKDKIEVIVLEVEKETPKQYILKKNKKYISRVYKSDIGYWNSSSKNAYGLTKEEAINVLKEHIKKEIEKYENYIKDLNSCLNCEIK